MAPLLAWEFSGHKVTVRLWQLFVGVQPPEAPPQLACRLSQARPASASARESGTRSKSGRGDPPAAASLKLLRCHTCFERAAVIKAKLPPGLFPHLFFWPKLCEKAPVEKQNVLVEKGFPMENVHV